MTGHEVMDDTKMYGSYDLADKIDRLEKIILNLNAKINNLENTIRDMISKYNSGSTSYAKFGGTQSIYCPKCKDHHDIPYIPGKYNLCGNWFARIDSDGEITTHQKW